MPDPLEKGLPRAVAVAWGMAIDPQRGPKRELSHERIVEAAIAIADAEGLSAVTMSKVATSLGFTTMSLYRYVTSKDELFQLMQDAVCAVPLPSEAAHEGWRAGLRAWARITHGVYTDHPWFLEIALSQLQLMTPNNLQLVDTALRALRDEPLTGKEKIAVVMLISGYARSFGLIEHDLAGHTLDNGTFSPADQAAALKELVTDDRFPDLSPLIQQDLYVDTGTGDLVDDFEFGLQRILDGLERYLADRPPRDPDPGDAADPLALEAVRKDKGVREAARLRKEAEGRLREAAKREKEMIKNVLARAKG